MKKPRVLRRARLGVLACWLGVLLAGGACQPQDRVIVNIRGKRELRAVAAVAQGQLTPALYDTDYTLVGEMALLSAVVYAGKKPPGNRPDYQRDQQKYAQERARLSALGWRPFPFSYRLQPPEGEYMGGGLTYDVWVKADSGRAPLAALVFRGTNFGELADWQANFRPLTNTPGLWDQYEQVRDLTPALVARLDAAYGGQQRIFATGHSLGGGLAQHAGYSCGRIEKVFAFNTSPLTGYYDLPKAERQAYTGGRRAFLVYESNEVLSVLRFVPGYLRNLWSKGDVVLLRYNFSSQFEAPRPFLQHGIQRLARGLHRPPEPLAEAAAVQHAAPRPTPAKLKRRY
ncbi:hypothetical protein GCM10023185_27960 [Hymenobacter saemangeumensis]|uniref:DUF2974 domain-containing protein n=1 Tax=Hymenobacter saemangeumensis TaxID=1084522 RepID=A0ABP8IKA0_9BACT